MTCPRCGHDWWGNLKPIEIDGRERLVRKCRHCGRVVNDAMAEAILRPVKMRGQPR